MEFAQSAPAALQRITDAAGASIILILSDINMPGMSGLEMLPKAKAARPDVPVIMITACGDSDAKRKALENGAEALFTKPIDFGALRDEIDQWANRRHNSADRPDLGHARMSPIGPSRTSFSHCLMSTFGTKQT